MQAAGNIANDIKKQATDFAQQKIDSAKKELKDSAVAIKNQAIKDVKDELVKQVLGNKDSTSSGKPLENTTKKAEEAVKNTLNNLLKKKK
jgi:vacuolar-type H+-ATPase subunit E/Vma4